MSISGVTNFGDILYNTIVVYEALKLFVAATMAYVGVCSVVCVM